MHSIYSAQGEYFDNVDEFLKKNPTQDEKNSAAFKFVKTCKLNSDHDPIERLLNSGVSPNCQDSEGKSLLMIAAERGFLELVQCLLESNVDMRLKDKTGRTALFYAIEANNENVDVVSFLLDHGADLNHEAQERATPLLRAVERGYFQITKLLLEKGANLHTGFEGSGDTALHIAVKRSDKRIINLLFEYGCDPNKKNKKKLTPRELCQNTNPELQQYLINLSSSQKVNQSNIIKTAIETPTMHQEYNRTGGPGGSDVPPIFDILSFDKDRGGENGNGNGNQQLQPDFSEQKRQKYQPNEGKKQKGRNESPPNAGIKRSNYFPQNPELASHNDELDDENSSTATGGTGGNNYQPYLEEQNDVQSGMQSGIQSGMQYQHQHQQNQNQNQGQGQGQGRRKNNMQQQNSEIGGGEQMQYGNPQGPGNFRQMKQQQQQHQAQNMPPQNFYNQQQQQQFFNNSNNNNNQQQQQQNLQKRKSNKGQGQNPNFNPSNPNNPNPKNFPNNNNPNFPTNNPNNQQNPYNRKGSGGAPPELNPVGQMSPTNTNGKFNKNQGQNQNQNRPQYNDKNAQRAYNMPPNMPGGMPHNMPQDTTGMENFSPQNPMKDSKMVQSPILYNNSTPNPNQMMAHAFHNPSYPDMRQGGVGYILPGPEGVGQQQQFGFNQSPQMNPMMNKQPPPQFIPGGGNFPYQNNPSLVDNSNLQNTNVKTFFYDLSDSLQKQNMRLKADFLTINKINKDTKKDSEKLKQENSQLKTTLEITRQNEQKLKKLLSEREALIEDLSKKSEELESAIKNATSKSAGATYEVASIVTEPMLETFQVETMAEILRNPRQNMEFLKPEYVSKVLHEEILAFEKAVNTFNLENNLTFESLIENMKANVIEAVPGAEWEIYGSFATGLCLPWSDIDIVIKAPQTAYGTTALDAMEASFKKKKFVEDAKVIRNTSVPVYKITCTKQYLNKKVDISLHDPRHNGILCVELVKEYLAFYPPLRSIVLILKQFLAKLNLNDTYLGGLSSYGLILMAVFLFQTREMQRATEPMDNQNLGALLLSFLYFYGFEYDYYTQFLVNPRKIPKGKDKQNDMLVDNYNLMHILNQNPPSIMEPKIIIQDPLSSTNNVGRSTFNIKEIKNAFMAAYFEAFKPCVCEVHRSISDIESINGKAQHKCASIFKRMMLAYHPQK